MVILRSPLVVIILTQLLFTTSDVMARSYMKLHGFQLQAFLTGWFILYLLIRQLATFGQLYVFANVELGRTIALFSASSIVLSNVVGVLLLGEVLSIHGYIGISLAILAFLVLALASI